MSRIGFGGVVYSTTTKNKEPHNTIGIYLGPKVRLIRLTLVHEFSEQGLQKPIGLGEGLSDFRAKGG